MLVLAPPAVAGAPSVAALNPVYAEECGSCHIAYPPRMLGAASWQRLLSGLDQHFGSDATVEALALADISAYTTEHARKRETSNGTEALIRITETAWFRHEHGDIAGRIWQSPKVKSKSNCGACHKTADHGIYSERKLNVPTGTGE